MQVKYVYRSPSRGQPRPNAPDLFQAQQELFFFLSFGKSVHGVHARRVNKAGERWDVNASTEMI